MVKNDSLFYLSGVISFFIFSVVVALFSYVLIINDGIKNFALQKANYISVSLNNVTVRTPKKETQKKIDNRPVTKEEQATSTPQPMKNADINSLFSDVKTNKIVHKKDAPHRDIDTKHIKQIQKRIQTKSTKPTSEAMKAIASMKLASISSPQSNATSTALEVNKYLAKIQATVYENFYPPINSEGSSAKIRIWMSASGKLEDYRILAYSGNDTFNEEVNALKQRLEHIAFAINPEGRSLSVDIILMAKE